MIASVKPRSSITSAEQAVHHADALVIDAGDPFAPEIGQPALQRRSSASTREDDDDDDRAGGQRDRLVEREWRPR